MKEPDHVRYLLRASLTAGVTAMRTVLTAGGVITRGFCRRLCRRRCGQHCGRRGVIGGSTGPLRAMVSTVLWAGAPIPVHNAKLYR